MDDNVIDLPTSRSEAQPDNIQDPVGPVVEDDSLEKRSDKSNEFMVELVDKQRKEGLALLNEKLEGLHANRELLADPKAENVSRYLSQALGAASKSMQALNSLLDVVIHDVGITVQNIHRHAHGLEQISTHLQATMNLALAKGVFTEEELREEVGKVLNPTPQANSEEEGESTTEEV